MVLLRLKRYFRRFLSHHRYIYAHTCIKRPTYPVALSELKAHVRVDGTAEDTYLTSLIKAATDFVEAENNREVVDRTWAVVLIRADYRSRSFGQMISAGVALMYIAPSMAKLPSKLCSMAKRSAPLRLCCDANSCVEYWRKRWD